MLNQLIYRGYVYRLKSAARSGPTIQYHATSQDRLASILEHGLRLPQSDADISTFRHSDIPTISTADTLEYALAYHPHGIVFTLAVDPATKWSFKNISNMRKNETLLDALQRWIVEAKTDERDAIYVGSGLQSTVGNQILNPAVLTIKEYIDFSEKIK